MSRVKPVLIFIFSLSVSLFAESSGYTEWLKSRESIKQDESVVAYYTFENLKEDTKILKDLSKNGRDLVYYPYKDRQTGKVYDDLEVVEGRWSEKPAVRMIKGYFRGNVSLNIENKQFTAECWFRRQGEGLNVLLSSSGFREGWQVGVNFWQGKAGEIYLGIGRPEVYYATVTAKKAIPENTWHHFATTWDGTKMKVYINGLLITEEVEMIEVEDGKKKKVKKQGYDGDYYPTKTLFQLNTGAGTVNLDRSDVTLDIDEVVIYKRVLSEEEISLRGKGFTQVSAEEIFLRADAFLKTKNYKSARTEYERLKALPNYGQEYSLFNIAESYIQEKDYVNTHKTFNSIYNIHGLTPYYQIHALFRQAEVYQQQKEYEKARQNYQKILKVKDALPHHQFTARLQIGETYKAEKKYSLARPIYEKLLIEEENSLHPHEGYRIQVIDNLELIDSLKDGETVISRQDRWLSMVNSPKVSIYVSPKGKDTNIGTKNRPFATLKRAQEEVIKIKEKGMPTGGIVVYLRGGKYFLSEGLVFNGEQDSGAEGSPVVYRSYPKEEVRLVGGVEVKKFSPLTDKNIISRLPKESKGKVWVSDLKAEGITDYGKYSNRGGYGGGTGYEGGRGKDTVSALELFCDGKPMQISRWPNKGYVRTGEVPSPEGEMTGRGQYQKSKFSYIDERPNRWLQEKDVWLHGFWYLVYAQDHIKLKSIDVENRTISLENDTRWHPSYSLYNTPVGKNMPYYVYNLLSEIDSPGEWYLDRDTGKLYFYPPGDIKKHETIVSLLETPIISVKNSSNLIFYGLTIECTRTNGVIIEGGKNNLIIGSTIRNVGQSGVRIKDGWNHGVVGCDIYDNGAGGVYMTGGDREKLIPSKHTAENNHIYRFNRFSGGGYENSINVYGVGQRVSYNLIHDSPSIAVVFGANDNILEFNELHDAPSEGREIGIMYTYGASWPLMNRGNLIRNNFFHHISPHSSPNLSQGVNAIHIDAINGGIVMVNNIFYRFSRGISNSQPENRIENNLFIEGEVIGISQGNRWLLFNTPDGEPLVSRISNFALRNLKRVRYKQPPWSYRYPQLVDMLYKEKPVGWAMDNVIERNINTGGPFISIASDIKDDNIIRNNWDGEDILFVDKENLNFTLRPGFSGYGLTGCDPISQKNIGVYESPLRATWPVKRGKEEIGKYYNPDYSPLTQANRTVMVPVKRISPPAYYTVQKRRTPITIDGKLDKTEWGELNLNQSIVVGKEHIGLDTKCAKSYAWVKYDNDNLYIGMKHDPDPFVEGMLPRVKNHQPWFEVGIETQLGTHSHGWWIDDMVTGPIYILTGKIDGEFVVHNPFKMPYERVKKLENTIEYKVSVINNETKEWTSEMKIPIREIGINPQEVEQLAFSLGTYKKAGFFNWIPTGTQLWRVENAGFIKFEK